MPSVPIASPQPTEFPFAPDAERAAQLDVAVRAGLAKSLAAVFDALEIDSGDAGRKRLSSALAAGPVAPGVFALYVEMVLATYADRDDEARATAKTLLTAFHAAPRPLSVVTLDDRDLGPGQAARYDRLLADDIGVPIAAVAAPALAEARRRLDSIFELLRAGAPDVFAESVALIRQIVVVSTGPGAPRMAFGAASSFALWGALVLNVECLDDRLHAADQIAHESAHTLLFGLAGGGFLTENDQAERYTSPLRPDLRPMEGVAHATFVAGRTTYVLESFLRHGVLTGEELETARRHVAASERAYAEGLATVEANAQLTPAGAAAFAGLRRHMNSRAPV